jgi:hypothetical protein
VTPRARTIAIDWSGAVTGAAKKIWLAEARAGDIIRLESGRTRAQITQHLIELADADPHIAVGLDFAFSMPEWFLRQRGFASAPQLWQRLAAGADERWLAACEPPFWGRPGCPKPASVETGLRLRDAASKAKSVFQIGGAGAVGTGSLRGMRELHHLRAAGFHVWPFDPPAMPLLVDIYPRALTGPVTKSDWAKRTTFLAGPRFATIAAPMRPLAASTEDAFDAAVSAFEMDAHRDELLALPHVTHPQLRLEGAIWRPGWTEAPLVAPAPDP